MRIAVLGAHGQLGRDLCPRLTGDVIPLTRVELDLSQPERIAEVLAAIKPDVLVNCAAYNLVDKAESDPNPAMAVNAWGVRELARTCAAQKIRLVQFSTDYVFGLDAARRTPWKETDAPGPVSVYGMSKLLGEYAVLGASPEHLVIRTCGLYGVWGSGGKGGNFVETMLRIANQGKPLKVVNDQFCTPSYTVDVALATIGLIASNATGLVQVTNSGSCTWYELAKSIFDQSKIEADLTPIESHQFDAPAKRPPYSVLSSERMVSFGVSPLRSWPDALAAYLIERNRR